MAERCLPDKEGENEEVPNHDCDLQRQTFRNHRDSEHSHEHESEEACTIRGDSSAVVPVQLASRRAAQTEHLAAKVTPSFVAADFTTKLGALRRGELIEQGTHLELRARGGLYAQLADLQERGLAKL